MMLHFESDDLAERFQFFHVIAVDDCEVMTVMTFGERVTEFASSSFDFIINCG